MAKEIHIRKPLAVGNDFIAKGFLAFLFVFFELVLKCLHQRIAQLLRGRFRPKLRGKTSNGVLTGREFLRSGLFD